MATIKDGYNGYELEIRVSANSYHNRAEVWTQMYDENTHSLTVERLHYATLQELVDLRDEINAAIKELAGV